MAAKAMNAPQKFLFDTSFECAEQQNQSVERAPQPKYFDEDLDRARAEGLSAGHDAGHQEAERSAARATERALASIGEQLQVLRQSLDAGQADRVRTAVEVAAALVRKIYPRFADDRGLAEIDAVVADAMTRLHDEPRIVVRVCDAMLDAVKDRVGELARTTGFEGRIVFLAQDGMTPDDVRVEWADGGAERDTERLWQEIDQMIRRMSGRSEVPCGTAGPTAQSNRDNSAGA